MHGSIFLLKYKDCHTGYKITTTYQIIQCYYIALIRDKHRKGRN